MEGFELSAAVSADNVFLINFAELQERLDPLFYNTVHGFSLVKHTTFPVKKLSEVIDMQRGRFGHRPRNEPKFYGGQYPFIQTGDVVKASQTNAPITYTQTLNELGLQTSRLFDKNVMVITIAANIGDTAILDYPACFPDSLIGITPKTEALTLNYLNIYFKFLKPYLEDIAPQSAQKNINYQQLSPVPIVMPPLAIQQNITDLYRDAHQQKQQKEQQVQTLLDGIDGYLLNELGIALPQQDNRLEKRMFTVPFSEVVGERVDPDYRLKYELLFSQKGKYEFVKLKELLIDTPQYGANEEGRERNSDEDVRYIRITDIDELGNLKNNDWKTAQNIEEQYLLKKDDILFARSGSVGRCYIHKETEQPAIFAGYLIRFKLNEQKLNSNFMFYYCNSKFYKFWVTAIERPAVQSNINAEEYKALPIPLPPIEKQNEIAAHISQIRAQAKQLQADAAQVLANAKAEIERMILGENS